jgi:predicted nucleic acid-binding protein
MYGSLPAEQAAPRESGDAGSMPKVTYDTNVFIEYDPAYFPSGFLMSSVVIQELAAGALDKTRLKKLDASWRYYQKEKRLLVPNGEDWFLAGKVLNSLYRRSSGHTRGRKLVINKDEQRRIIRDVLIARTARRENATVITKNLSDFEKIRPYCAVIAQHPEDFFG